MNRLPSAPAACVRRRLPDDARYATLREWLALGQRRTTASARRTQRLDHALLQRTARMRVDRGMDRFMVDVSGRIIRMYAAQSGGDLLWRPAVLDQPVVDVLMQRLLRVCAGEHTADDASETPSPPSSDRKPASR